MAQPTASESRYYSIVLILFSLMFTTPSIGQTWGELIKLTASDVDSYDRFGYSVCISGERALVGAFDDDGTDSGSVYIFDLVGCTWTETQKLMASDAAPGDKFGLSVSISGDHAIIGAPWNKDHGDRSGSAYIFTLVGDTWVETQKLTASDAAGGDVFGGTVSILGDRAIVGARLNNDDGLDSGSAYIFDLVGGTWVETQKLTASDADAEDEFGASVSLSDNRVIIGAPVDLVDVFSGGSAYIFDLIGDTWVETQKISASDGETGDNFGISTSISGDRVLIGAVGIDDYRGAAYIFDLVGDTWVETQKLIAMGIFPGDFLGRSVSLSGDYAIIGAHRDDNDFDGAGSAIIFSLVEDTWVETQNLTPSDADAWDQFGWAVSISEDRAIIGARLDNAVGENSGSAYIFETDLIQIAYTTTDEVFGEDASIDITVTGGTPGYIYDWDTDGTGDFDDDEDLIDIAGGTYIVAVKDEVGCVETATIEVGSQLNIESLSSEMTVYPIPSPDMVTIELQGTFVYSLVSLKGKLLLESNAENNAIIDLSTFDDGIYFVKIQSEGISKVVKLVKE